VPSKANPAKRGRKPAWRDGYLEQAKKLAVLGLTDAELADFYGVSIRTYMRWKASKPEFCHALKAGKAIADARVERKLYERAIGCKTNAVKIMNIRGKVVSVTYVIEHPPDTTACIFWLKNRDPENWREKIEVDHRHQFKFIGAIPSEEEWLERYGTEKEPLTIEVRSPIERPDGDGSDE